ncbi:hypothetical protein EKO27_g2553 [Xylaria grammica]|uniref:Terpene cyclase/mutase family member n=1 Tax=Xylaria grammica TaxID=363999 RepID=A0A439DDP1_9PEZI|nr:hypothetical protein EKO27_g2553 [Xylaria grammica]
MAPSFTMTMTNEDVSSIQTTFSRKVRCLEKDNEHYGVEEWTDLRRWRLHAENGRHTWKYLENDQELLNNPDQTFREKYWLGLHHEEVPEQKQREELSLNLPQSEQRHWQTLDALKKGSSFLRQLQMEDGSWGSNCDGPMFITSGIVFACYIVGIPLPRPVRQEMCRYLVETCNADGGWGIYISGPSTVFGTGINYVMLRILGLGPTHPTCKKARDLLISMGGVVSMPTWGRFWLCVMNLYDWDGIVPLPSEILLTPPSFQLNPANWWMPIRNIYMGMCYLYGHRFQAPENDLIKEIRGEIYAQSYGEITNWPSMRPYVSAIDLVKPKSLAQSAVVSALSLWEWFGSSSAINWLRTRGLNEALFQVEADVHTTEYCSYSPAYWAVDIIVLRHAHGPESDWVQCMTPHFADGLWMCREGLAASGTDGNAVWETSLSVQAICSSIQLSSDNHIEPVDLEALNAGLEFLGDSQLLHDPVELHRTNRHPTKGGWPYSTHSQGYIVSDCTAETILAILQSRQIPDLSQRIPIKRLELAVDSLIGLESGKSGFGAYEQVRGWELLEFCNITDTYEDCMIERRYAETTGSVMTALTEFNAEYPGYRGDDIRRCIDGGAAYLLRAQYHHGGWRGAWGVCFTFATMWALEGLACAGYTEQNCAAVAKACAFLLKHQNSDGGWGESLESYRAKDYVAEPEGSQVPNTAYVIVGLLAAQCTDQAAIERGVGYLTKAQQPNGEWLPGTLEGIYTPPCGYRYPLYKFHFTLKALACYARRYGDNLGRTSVHARSEKGSEK